MDKKNNGIFGILTFTNDDEFDNFKKEMNILLDKNKYKNQNGNGNIICDFKDDEVCICNIYKEKSPSWHKNIVYNENLIINKNNTYYRIILLKYSENNYYFERNGNINVGNILENYDFYPFSKDMWKNKLNSDLPFKELIKNYLKWELTNDLDCIIKEIKDTDIIKMFNSIKVGDINSYENIYKNIDKLQVGKKLIEYDWNECKQKCKNSVKQSETVYNENVCEGKNYILLDRRTIKGCEVADIYDTENNLFFHNKKSGDLRCLGFQIIIGAMILKDTEKCGEYFDMLETNKIDTKNINIKDFNYVAGIIQMKKTINLKDRITLGIVYEQLKKMEIGFYIDEINVINKP